jgi:hypothetical protein
LIFQEQRGFSLFLTRDLGTADNLPLPHLKDLERVVRDERSRGLTKLLFYGLLINAPI